MNIKLLCERYLKLYLYLFICFFKRRGNLKCEVWLISHVICWVKRGNEMLKCMLFPLPIEVCSSNPLHRLSNTDF